MLDQTGIGLTPTLTWGAPTLGSVQRYRLTLERLAVSQGETRVAASVDLDTPNTSIRLPPGLLVAGQVYVISLAAYRTGGVVDPSLFTWRMPYHASTVVSGLLRP